MLIEFVIPGIIIGVSAAISPGPLLLLIVSETLRGGVRSGWKVAISPLITDVPFIITSILLAKRVGSFQPLIGLLSLVGAAFLVFLAYENITVRREDLEKPSGFPPSFSKAIVANVLNPYMYIFWFSVALPIFAKKNIFGSSLFAAAFLFSVILSMMGLVMLIALVRKRVLNYLHRGIRILSFFLLLIAAVFVREGVRLL